MTVEYWDLFEQKRQIWQRAGRKYIGALYRHGYMLLCTEKLVYGHFTARKAFDRQVEKLRKKRQLIMVVEFDGTSEAVEDYR